MFLAVVARNRKVSFNFLRFNLPAAKEAVHRAGCQLSTGDCVNHQAWAVSDITRYKDSRSRCCTGRRVIDDLLGRAHLDPVALCIEKAQVCCLTHGEENSVSFNLSSRSFIELRRKAMVFVIDLRAADETNTAYESLSVPFVHQNLAGAPAIEAGDAFLF